MRLLFSKLAYVALAVVGIAAVFYVAHHQARQGDSVGNLSDHPPAPEFTLPTPEGQSLSLSEYRGKVVLLDFWATWCEPCRDEIPRFVALQEKYRDQGLQIIGASMDDGPDPVRDFDRQFKMNYPIVMGNAKLGEVYGGVLGLPIAFLIGRDGRIYAKHIGATNAAVFEKEIVGLLQKQN